MAAQDEHDDIPNRIASRLRRLRHRLERRNNLQLPHFLILGTQKGGTTSLHHLLKRHPGIFLPDVKEVHYFSQHSEKPLAWYASHYQEASPIQIRGDITPFYLFHCKAPQRIREALPHAQLIALLRDPVERTLSQYFHARRHGYETLNLEEALEAEHSRLSGAELVVKHAGGNHYSYQKHSYVKRSRYDEQLKRYRRFFPEQQLLVLRSEDLFDKTAESWAQILSFIGAQALTLPGDLPHSNAGGGEAQQVSTEIRQRLREELAPTYQWLEHHYGISWPMR